MKEALVKIVKGALIAGVGALATYLITELGKLDFGQLTPFIAAGLAVLANFLRKFIPIAAGAMMTKKSLVLLPFLLLIPMSTHAQNYATPWSWGPTIALTKVPLSGGEKTYLSSGLGVGFYRNTLMDDTGTVSRLTFGIPIYVSGASDPNQFALTSGITLGTFNNLVAAGLVVDFVKIVDGENVGLASGLKDSTSFVFAFNLNLGSGEPAGLSRQVGSLATGKSAHAGPPPNYWRLW